MIVGLMAVAALDSLGAATRSAESIGNRAVAAGLADELMAEILRAEYSEPSGGTAIGLNAGETAGMRSTFDDVDDYHNFNQSPPKYRDGATMPGRVGWRQRVQVKWVVPLNPSANSATDQGVKQICVTIEHDGKVLAQQYAVRANN